jgi:hypothetical protein
MRSTPAGPNVPCQAGLDATSESFETGVSWEMLEQRTVDEETEATHQILGSETWREQLVYCEKLGLEHTEVFYWAVRNPSRTRLNLYTRHHIHGCIHEDHESVNMKPSKLARGINFDCFSGTIGIKHIEELAYVRVKAVVQPKRLQFHSKTMFLADINRYIPKA